MAIALEPNVNSGNGSADKDNELSKVMALHWNFGLNHVDLCLLDFVDFEDISSLVF